MSVLIDFIAVKISGWWTIINSTPLLIASSTTSKVKSRVSNILLTSLFNDPTWSPTWSQLYAKSLGYSDSNISIILNPFI